MSAALRLYEQLTEAKDDKTRARLIAEAFDELEARFPQLADFATEGHVRESELRLQKEIEGVRKEIKELEGRIRKEITEAESRLRKEIEQIRLETKALEVRLTQAIHRQTIWIVGAVGAIVGRVRVLDALIK
jgi:IMP dehydrogenase/GMP reductase